MLTTSTPRKALAGLAALGAVGALLSARFIIGFFGEPETAASMAFWTAAFFPFCVFLLLPSPTAVARGLSELGRDRLCERAALVDLGGWLVALVWCFVGARRRPEGESPAPRGPLLSS